MISDLVRLNQILPKSTYDLWKKAALEQAGPAIEKAKHEFEYGANSLLKAEVFFLENGQVKPRPESDDPAFAVGIARNGEQYIMSDSPEFRDPKHPGLTKPEMVPAAHLVATIMLMLRARTPILKVNEAEISSFQRSRIREKARDGKVIDQPMHVIGFDLSREFRRNPNQSQDEASTAMIEHLVMGHLKLRESGIFLWSPHWRGGTEEEKAERRSREPMRRRSADVTLNVPQKLIIPGMESIA